MTIEIIAAIERLYNSGVTKPLSIVNQGSCTCLKFQKLYKCKHIMGIALREKMISVPEHLVCTFLQKKKGVGAPKKAKCGKYLIID